MKKIFALALAATLALGLTACGSSETCDECHEHGHEHHAAVDIKKMDAQKDPRGTLKAWVEAIENDPVYKNIEQYLSEEGKKKLPAFQSELEKAKKLLADQNSSNKDMLALLDYKEDGKKVKGTLHKLLHSVTADLTVAEHGQVKNIHTNKMYSSLKDKSFEFTSKVPNLPKYFKVTTVTKAAYDKFPAADQADSSTHATPKYERKTMDKNQYKLEKTGDNTYKVTFKEIPSDVLIVKPVVVVVVGGVLAVENGDLVYVSGQ